jgi:hypothetical protein
VAHDINLGREKEKRDSEIAWTKDETGDYYYFGYHTLRREIYVLASSPDL